MLRVHYSLTDDGCRDEVERTGTAGDGRIRVRPMEVDFDVALVEPFGHYPTDAELAELVGGQLRLYASGLRLEQLRGELKQVTEEYQEARRQYDERHQDSQLRGSQAITSALALVVEAFDEFERLVLVACPELEPAFRSARESQAALSGDRILPTVEWDGLVLGLSDEGFARQSAKLRLARELAVLRSTGSVQVEEEDK